MATAEERYMEWLRDAHAMEQQAETMLSSMAGRIQNYPDVRAKIEMHLDQTRSQAAQIERCIERRGGDTSTLKDIAGKVMAFGQGVGGMMMGDEIIKGAMASYAFEQPEVATYRVLIAAADKLGDTETSTTCANILREEEEMARWLLENLGNLTERYLEREETPELEAQT
ncbi:ferritin-like domain-containing protein [Bosea sp. TND4EK4]|uniref:ferritin-like domain-containing protein n=1 Tax=Bosea sp. TND4EK4 TaxID=1907408 RepID=UPI000956B5C7|nr:ferritin-like domain-containing protein [Bosea sp. TND4EK4]SIR18333.1 Ferritin-like metal-binding protein YciE [Bosea sp. TND4EK4]